MELRTLKKQDLKPMYIQLVRMPGVSTQHTDTSVREGPATIMPPRMSSDIQENKPDLTSISDYEFTKDEANAKES